MLDFSKGCIFLRVTALRCAGLWPADVLAEVLLSEGAKPITLKYCIECLWNLAFLVSNKDCIITLGWLCQEGMHGVVLCSLL